MNVQGESMYIKFYVANLGEYMEHVILGWQWMNIAN